MLNDIFIAMNTPEFADYVKHFGYIGIFIWWITFDQLSPLPEEITLLAIGYLSANAIFNPILAGIVSLVAFLILDVTYFLLAKSGNKLIEKFYGKINVKFINKIKEKIKSNMPEMQFVLCFIPRTRQLGHIFAGLMNLPYKKIFLFDALGLFFFTALYIALGLGFHNGLYAILAEFETTRHGIFITVISILAIISLILLSRIRKEQV